MLNNKLICRINFTVIKFISVIHSFLKKQQQHTQKSKTSGLTKFQFSRGFHNPQSFNPCCRYTFSRSFQNTLGKNLNINIQWSVV